MGRRIKQLSVCVLLILSLIVRPGTGRAEEAPSIEQVFVNMPEVTVYGSGWTEGTLEASLGQEALTYEGVSNFFQTGEPVYYYVLLDVSNSMTDVYFQAVKQAIISFEGRLRPQDRMALYTFGETVEQKLPEEHNPEDTAAVLEDVINTDNRTLMFEAVRMASERAAQIGPEVCKRKVILVISDGEDFNIGSTGAAEAADCLKKTGIPAYAFAIKDTARENINGFGEFARTSGGTLTVFDAQQAPMVLDSFPDLMENSQVISWRAGSNQETNRLETFSMKTASNQTVSRDVMVSRHIRDLEIPWLVTAELLERDQIAVEFSEKVEGAEVPSHYILTKQESEKKEKKNKDKDKDEDSEDKDSADKDKDEDSGKDSPDETIITVLSVSVDKEVPNRMILSFSEELKPGTYTIGCVDIFDCSMEKNKVVNEAELEVEQLPLGERIFHLIREWYWIGLILIAVILIAVIVHSYRKVKRGQGVVYIDGKPVMASEVEIHKHIAIQEQKGKEFHLRISVKGQRPEDLTLYMNESFIVGRAQMCNLYFDDKRMSRQHFALEWDGQYMYVTDLETTNGTAVNKVPIHERRRLQQNDVISAGSVEFAVRW